MKSRVNPLAIGMFVLGATAIAVTAIMVFGAAKFFKNEEFFVSMFVESVNGLDVGAPVKYKGVSIGKVERIKIQATNSKEELPRVAVIYSIDMDLFGRRAIDSIGNFDKWLAVQLKEGLMAKLNYQSMVTGMLYVELDYFSDENADVKVKHVGGKYIEIPSKNSGFAELAKILQKTIKEISEIDFKAIGDNANSLFVKLGEKVDKFDVEALNKEALETISTAKSTLETAKSTLEGAKTTLSNVDEQFKSLAKSGETSLANVDILLETLEKMLEPSSPLMYEVGSMLNNLKQSTHSLTTLLEYLHRNPSSIITGRARNVQFENINEKE